MLARIATRVVRKFVSFEITILFLFGVVSGIWNLNAPIPDNCLSFYLATRSYGTNTYRCFYNIHVYKLHPKYGLLKSEV